MTVSHGHRQLPHCILLEAKTLPLEGASIPWQVLGFLYGLCNTQANGQ